MYHRASYSLMWPCLALYGLIWPYMALYGLVWPCLALYGLVWPCIVLYVFVGFFVDFHVHGPIWHSMALWFILVLYGLYGLFMVLYGIIWLHMAEYCNFYLAVAPNSFRNLSICLFFDREQRSKVLKELCCWRGIKFQKCTKFVQYKYMYTLSVNK